MRITNSMISKNSMNNMNTNKTMVNTLNNQMSSQKKISRPSEDPVVAIRALRLRSNLNELNQYYEKNIPDAESWMEITESALKNMKEILTTVRTQCDAGSNDSLTAEDRSAILKNLQSLRKQVYAESNADYAGRTVFTGYKTNSTMTFLKDDSEIKYSIKEPISYQNIEEKSYYSNLVTVPTTSLDVQAGVAVADLPQQVDNKRIRLSYDNLGDMNADDLKYIAADGTETALNTYTYTDENGATQTVDVTTDLSYSDWADGGYQVADNEVIYLKETGELILGKDVANQINSNRMQLTATYTKEGFKNGELRPEQYFDCQNITDPANVITYTKENQEISYTIAFNQTLVVNTQGSDVFNSSIGRDVDDLTDAVQAAIAAHDKVDKIKSMMEETQYADAASQEGLSQWLEAAQKEAAYADDNMQKLYSQGIGKFDSYLSDVVLATTDLGSRADRLALTKNRMSNQQATYEELKSNNEDKDLSDIIIEYTSAYTAYQASLQASAKANGQTLLNYL